MIVTLLLLIRLLHLSNDFVTMRERTRNSVCCDLSADSRNSVRDSVQRITAHRNGLRPTSGRIRKAAPVTVAPDVVTSSERRDEAHDSSVSFVRHVVLLKVCRTDGGYTRHIVPVYRYPFDLSDIPISRGSEQHSHLAELVNFRGVKKIDKRSLSRFQSRQFQS